MSALELLEQIATIPGNVVVSSYMAGRQAPDPMDAEEWARVRAILHRALELAPELRLAYLDDACRGDAHLRTEVESLLAASERSAFIDRPALASDAPTVTIEQAPPSLLKVGQTVAHYQVVEKIGEGGMGEVYKAVDTRLDRLAALKVISHALGGGHEKQRFAREAKAASALNHPNIVTIYEFNTECGLDFIAMEYIQGATLNKLIGERKLPLETLLEYARQAAGAIAKAHAAGIVHRDLKPNNIMVTAEGVVKVLDFGLAKQEHSAASDPESTQTQALTVAGTVVGTPAYMSPEQAMGEPADWRSDIFSFGVLLYEIACGRRPFQGKNSQAMLHQIAHKDPPSPAEVNPAAPPELAALIEKCL
jgi:serine/threonine protein kinase